MNLNTKAKNLSTVHSQPLPFTTSVFDKTIKKVETIISQTAQLELDLIYLEKDVIMLLKEKDKVSKHYCRFDPQVARRVKNAWEWNSQDELIAIATASEKSLFVVACDFTAWEIPFKSISCLDRVPKSERPNFEIDEDGSYLYYPCADLHVDLEDLKAAADPEFKEQLMLEKLEYGKSFGKAIAMVRKAHKLTQNDINGISDRHLRRIENEGYQPTLDTLKKLSESHGLDLEDYLSEVNDSLST